MKVEIVENGRLIRISEDSTVTANEVYLRPDELADLRMQLAEIAIKLNIPHTLMVMLNEAGINR